MSYNPRQPRDKDGRWTDAGGGGPADAKTLGPDPRPAEKGYAYHATNVDALRKIAKSGKLMTRTPGRALGQSYWPDGYEGPRLYAVGDNLPSGGYARGSHGSGGRPVVVRFRQSDAPKLRTEYGSGYLVSSKPIPADKLQYLAQDNSWRPVAERPAHNTIGHSGIVPTGPKRHR